MMTNLVLIERTIRLGSGMLLLASPLLELPTYPFNLLGIVLVATGFVGYSPLYGLLRRFGASAPANQTARGRSPVGADQWRRATR